MVIEDTSLDVEGADVTPHTQILWHAVLLNPSICLCAPTHHSGVCAVLQVGVNVRWMMDNISEFDGKAATWRVMLAMHDGAEVLVYEGVTQGRIVRPRGDNNFGFDPVFCPDGQALTLAEVGHAACSTSSHC